MPASASRDLPFHHRLHIALRSGTWRDTAVAIKQLSLDEDRDDAETLHNDFLREAGLWVHLVSAARSQAMTR